jgi:hypothetical protein
MSSEEKKAPENVMGPWIQCFITLEERESLLSTNMRLNWSNRTDAQGGLDSPRISRFRVAMRRISSGSIFV